MKRRGFISFAGGAAVWPFAARAQQPKVPVIGILSSFGQTQSAQTIAAILRGLSENGFVEGQSLTVEYRFADGQYDRLPGLAAELVRRPVDLIITAAPPAAVAAKAATTTIPIVFVMGSDPVAAGVVASLSRPGGNATGMMLISNTLTLKRLGVLFELVPSATTIALLVNPFIQDSPPEIEATQAFTQQRGLQLEILNAATLSEIDAVFSSLAKKTPARARGRRRCALFESAQGTGRSSARLALPAIYPYREFPASGGLISYGTNRPIAYQQAGAYASRVLKGAKTTDLPVMEPVTFELVINLKTAKALGLAIPPTLLALADEVID